MATANSTPSTLFIHGGPGLNLSIERRWFGNRYPIEWWDQPALPQETADVVAALTRSTIEKLMAMQEASGSPVAIVAHSYGGHVARSVADSIPERVHSLVLLATGVDIRRQYLRLARHLMTSHADVVGIRAAAVQAASDNDLPTTLGLAGAITSRGNWRREFFAPESNDIYARYMELVAYELPMDFPTFIAGVNCQLKIPPVSARSRYKGPVRLLLGRDDPLVDTIDDATFWRETFPQTDIKIVAGGHMLHFELRPERWLPSLI